MDNRPLGRLERVDLRAYWKNEFIDFTPWLASAENIKLLGDAMGLELEVEEAELVTCDPALGEGPLGVIPSAWPQPTAASCG